MLLNEDYLLVLFDLEPNCLALLQLYFKALNKAELCIK